jgi:hypothetical protein
MLLAAPLAAQGNSKSDAVKDPKLRQSINRAIARGAANLKRAQRKNGRWRYSGREEAYSAGMTALCLYALAASSVPRTDPAIERGLKWVLSHGKGYGKGARYATYSASLLTLALARIDAQRHRKTIQRLAARLVDGQGAAGRWSYTLTGAGGDLSNSQFAIMAIWTAARLANARIPKKTWQRVCRSLESCQAKDGSWAYGYGPARGTPSMTAAGLFGFVAAHASLSDLATARKQVQAQRGVRALLRTKPYANFYFCYGLERAAAIMDVPADQWYVAGARQLVERQQKSGSWGNPYSTSLALLFLTRATRYVITPRRPRTLTAREVKFPMKVTPENLGRAFEAYLLADERARKTLPRRFAGAGPSAIGLFVERLGDPEQSVRRVAHSLLRLLLSKPLLFDPNAPGHDRRIMLKPIRDWFEREGKNLAWDEQTGRFQS